MRTRFQPDTPAHTPASRHRRTWARGLTGLCLGLVLAGAACAQDNRAPVADWEADLDAFLTVLHAEHDNPYFHTPREQFEAEIAAYREALPELSRAERITGFAHLVALVGDGHTWMAMHPVPFDGLPPGPGFRSLPVRFELFADGLYIVGAPSGQADLLGARVLAFEGVPVETAMARGLSLLPSDAVNFSDEMLPEWLMQAELLEALDLASTADRITLSLSFADGTTQDVQLSPMGTDARYDWIFSRDTGPVGQEDWVRVAERTPVWMEDVPVPSRALVVDGVAYLQILQVGNGPQSYADVAAQAVALAEQQDRPALIIDLRRCVGGDGTLNPGLIEAITSSDALMQPGRMAVLTSRRTHSAAVMLVSALEQSTPARFYGQPTADRPNHHGETNIFVTPNSQLPLIHASEYYQTSTPDDDRLFVTPDVEIPEQFSDFAAGRDPVLSAALTDLKG